jgi:hypothetical protein
MTKKEFRSQFKHIENKMNDIEELKSNLEAYKIIYARLNEISQLFQDNEKRTFMQFGALIGVLHQMISSFEQLESLQTQGKQNE